MPASKIVRLGDPHLNDFSARRLPARRGQPLVGWREWVGLPDLGIVRIIAKMDTGAKTSALHANSLKPVTRNGAAFIRFDVIGEGEEAPWHELPVLGRRSVRSSNGESEMRYVVNMRLRIGAEEWLIDVTLTNRERMEMPMLIGREALAGRVLVDAAKSWLGGAPARQKRPAKTPRAKTRVAREPSA
jgi:hypothetical protein